MPAEGEGGGAARRPVLFVAATPIGNLGDLTARAVEALRACDFVACEDTRRSLALAPLAGARKEVLSLHRFNEERRAGAVIERLARGQTGVYVSDGGTPAVSDPGARLVRRVRAAGFAVSPLPGASAVTAAVSVSGWEGGFVFMGFVERSRGARMRQLELAARLPWASVLFDSPARVRGTLEDVAAVFGERKLLLARELTKLHEEIVEESAARLLERLGDAPRGEITLVLFPAGGAEGAVEAGGVEGGDIEERVKRAFGGMRDMCAEGVRPMRAAAIASRLTGVPKRMLAEAHERAKEKGRER